MSKNIHLEGNGQLKDQYENLKKQLEDLENKNQDLTNNILKEKEEFRRRVTWWGLKIISLLVLFYLFWLMIAPQKLKPKEITTEDIILVSIILLFNSGFLEKIESFSVEGTKVEAKFQNLEQRQEQQKDEINKLQQQQIDLQKQQINSLSAQQLKIDDLQKRQNFALAFLYRNLLEKYEIEKLEQLKKSQDNQESFPFSYIPEAGKELRHLRALGFIRQNQYGLGIRSMEKDQRKTKEKLDLTKYFHITDAGRQYLELVKEFKMNEDLETPSEEI